MDKMKKIITLILIIIVFLSAVLFAMFFVDRYRMSNFNENTTADSQNDGLQTDETTDKQTEDAQTDPPEPTYVPVSEISFADTQVLLVVGQPKSVSINFLPENATNKGFELSVSDTAIATVDENGNLVGVSEGSCTVTVKSVDNPELTATVNLSSYIGVAPTYIDGILVVNKTYALPKSYAPGWDAEASSFLLAMFADAKLEGINLWVNSGYRSYIDQYIIYNDYVAKDGQAEADTYSARPGHSEHQSGLAFDLNNLTQEFGSSPEGIWLANNCHKYGFIIRYQKDKEHITGYIYEPWHIRYLGVEKATEVYESGLCLEEFLGITSSYS